MSQCESMKSSLDSDNSELSEGVKNSLREKLLKQWESDDDIDDILLKFVEKIGIAKQDFEVSTLQASQDYTERTKSIVTIDIDYTIINDLHRLKHVLNLSPDKKYNLQDIKILIEQLEADGLLYLKGLLDYINGDYDFNDAEDVSDNKKILLFRKLLEATIPAMKHLHDTIKSNSELPKETKKLFRVWRRSMQEKNIFGDGDEYKKNIKTDVFLSTSTSIAKVKTFYKNQCTRQPGGEVPIIWEISMDKQFIHPDSRIPNSGLDELVLNIGSILEFQSEESITCEPDGQSFKLKKFVYKGHVTEESTSEFYGKSSYDDAIAKFAIKPKINLKGGKNTQRKKEIMGRTRCIYKKPNDRKEYVKYKGELVTLKEFKNNFKKKS